MPKTLVFRPLKRVCAGTVRKSLKKLSVFLNKLIDNVIEVS